MTEEAGQHIADFETQTAEARTKEDNDHIVLYQKWGNAADRNLQTQDELRAQAKHMETTICSVREEYRHRIKNIGRLVWIIYAGR
eukprot:3423708-Pyramimonas_sp.AAC.1